MMSTICNAKDVPMHVIKAYSEVEIYLHSFLNSLLGGSEKSVSHPSQSTTKEKVPVPFKQEAVWTPEPFHIPWRGEKLLTVAENLTMIPWLFSPYYSASFILIINYLYFLYFIEFNVLFLLIFSSIWPHSFILPCQVNLTLIQVFPQTKNSCMY